ncbi:MAG: hypothetical protein EPO31_01670 [Gammaproteobacteria bacterium]|nr:MAG: hypothetical protein EPO31_01670 [Gammaproteobacteria bacterium]
MCKRSALVSLGLLVALTLTGGHAWPAEPLFVNGGFEQGLVKPWGTGMYSEDRPLWWNSGDCDSTVELDERGPIEGIAALHIVNLTPRTAHVYGTVAQRVRIEPNRPYRITLWARGLDLASAGAVTLIVDEAWKVRPIALPGGSFAWTKLSGTFSLPADYADIRILSEDAGEAWIDDVRIEPLNTLLQ